jgi:4-amino-4-deoxy-L-arabinose transferase-like glycosyltransferase
MAILVRVVRAETPPRSSLDWIPYRPWEVWSLAALCLLAFLLRIVNLEGNPAILSGNEAGVGLSAREFIDGRRTNLFSVAWWSFPSLYAFVQSLPLRLFGPSVFGLRLTSVVVGTATVAATYIYARDVFDRRVALLAAGFLAGFGFHIHFSRLGLSNVWDGLFAVGLAAALTRSWRSGAAPSFLMPGLVIGLAQYFYLGSRILLVLLVVWILLAKPTHASSTPRRWASAAYVLAGALIAVLPLGLFYVRHPDEFLAPWSRVSLFWYWWDVQTIRYGDPGWWVIGEQAIKSVLGFVSARLTEFYDGQPMLTAPAALLFIVGLIVALRRRREAFVLWLGLWIAGTILVVALSANPPAAQRYVTSAPAVAVLVGLGAATVVQLLSKASGRWSTWTTAAAAGMLVLVLAAEGFVYFGRYSANRTFGDYNAETADRVARWLATRPARARVYFFVSPRMGLSSHETVLFLLPGLEAIDFTYGAEWEIDAGAPGVYDFVALPERAQVIPLLQSCFPGGSAIVETARGQEPLFSAYEVSIQLPASCSGD